ncbi:hypothetical protein MUP07_09035 [Candidatus Bathyarchaeota archaeon]|nr:hypothetical protein [Candidatus Bathyarchaeota archaeon]
MAAKTSANHTNQSEKDLQRTQRELKLRGYSSLNFNVQHNVTELPLSARAAK